jgi:hypothetical protein
MALKKNMEDSSFVFDLLLLRSFLKKNMEDSSFVFDLLLLRSFNATRHIVENVTVHKFNL